MRGSTPGTARKQPAESAVPRPARRVAGPAPVPARVSSAPATARRGPRREPPGRKPAWLSGARASSDTLPDGRRRLVPVEPGDDLAHQLLVVRRQTCGVAGPHRPLRALLIPQLRQPASAVVVGD